MGQGFGLNLLHCSHVNWAFDHQHAVQKVEFFFPDNHACYVLLSRIVAKQCTVVAKSYQNCQVKVRFSFWQLGVDTGLNRHHLGALPPRWGHLACGSPACMAIAHNGIACPEYAF